MGYGAVWYYAEQGNNMFSEEAQSASSLTTEFKIQSKSVGWQRNCPYT